MQNFHYKQMANKWQTNGKQMANKWKKAAEWARDGKEGRYDNE